MSNLQTIAALKLSLCKMLEVYWGSGDAQQGWPKPPDFITEAIELSGFDVRNGYLKTTAPRGLSPDELMKRDFEAWQRGDTIQVGKLVVSPKRDLTGFGVTHGWNVCKGGCNALPGATWAHTRDEALMLLHAYVAVGEETDFGGKRFWAFVSAIGYATGKEKVI